MKLQPLTSDSPAIIYLDFKSPYAYLAIEPTRALERELGVKFDWRPFVLDIPSYLGSARLDAAGNVAEQNRSEEQWAGVKYAYYDCRRYARLYRQTIRGTVKIWDTNLAATAMFWLRNSGYETQQRFLDLVFQPFWKRELDIEDSAVIEHLVDEVGADGQAFSEWARTEGMASNAQFQSTAFSEGIFGVPTYVVGTQLYFGRENLPRVRWQLLGQRGSAPDIANPLPASMPEQTLLPTKITVGLDDSLDSLLALPPLLSLLRGYTGTIDWVKIAARKAAAPATASEHESGSRGALHQEWRKINRIRHQKRYDTTAADSREYAQAIDRLLIQNQISLKEVGPKRVTQPAMEGVVVLWGDELFIGRQHLPLIAARLSRKI